MAIGTNDAIVKLGTTKTLEASGNSIANNTLELANDASYSIAADGANAPDAEFVLALIFATAPTEGASIGLYARELDVDGTGDEEVPETTFKPHFIGSFPVNNVTTAQYIKLLAQDVPRVADYYLFNNGTGQTVSANWTLKVTPRTLGPAA